MAGSTAAVQAPGALDFGVEIAFVSQLGFTLHRMDSGHSELRCEARPEHLNSFDVTHGGATMALLDMDMDMAMSSSVQRHTRAGCGDH